MKNFADLYTALDETTRTSEKVAALVAYFMAADPADAAWAVYFLSGRTVRRVISGRALAEWAVAEANLPDWLFGECYDAVGDIAETITLLLPDTGESSREPLAWWVEARLLPLQTLPDEARRAVIVEAWRALNMRERFIWNKLLTGGFRVGVSQKLVTRALAEVSGVDESVIAHRLMGEWQPTPDFFASVVARESATADRSQPYPFYLAYPLEETGDLQAALGSAADWQAELKWDGIRAQIIRRGGEVFIWTRGEELVTDRYPEIAALAARLPDGVALDGELLPWKDGEVLPFALLQRRIGRKTLSKKLLADIPVVFMAYDLLEQDGRDVRSRPLRWRRDQLSTLVASLSDPTLMLSPVIGGDSWTALDEIRSSSRFLRVEGLMLKRLDSAYQVGRRRGDWWKWKVQPYTVDAVLIYAQRGSGKRASLYTDYTFGVWDANGELVPFAKAYSGLTDEEIAEVDAFIRRNTREKFGPVRTVTPELVFELAFEGIQRSTRHKAGVAVRFPRILRWRRDKPAGEADSLASIRALLPRDS
jgi:DNA ligase-1